MEGETAYISRWLLSSDSAGGEAATCQGDCTVLCCRRWGLLIRVVQLNLRCEVRMNGPCVIGVIVLARRCEAESEREPCPLS